MYKLNASAQNYRIAFYFLVWTARSKKIHVNGCSSHLRGNTLILLINSYQRQNHLLMPLTKKNMICIAPNKPAIHNIR